MANVYDVVKKYPFIYEIDGQLFHIGAGVFEKCTNHLAEGYFEKYREEIARIGRENIQPRKLEKFEYEGFLYCYRKVLIYSDCTLDGTKVGEVNRQIKGFVERLSEKTQKHLLEQIEDYERVYWYHINRK